MPRKREKIKIIVLFRSYTRRNRKFVKNCNKIQKIKKIQLRLLFKQKLVGKDREIEKIQIIVSFRSTYCVIENCKQIAKKFKKLE